MVFYCSWRYLKLYSDFLIAKLIEFMHKEHSLPHQGHLFEELLYLLQFITVL